MLLLIEEKKEKCLDKREECQIDKIILVEHVRRFPKNLNKLEEVVEGQKNDVNIKY